ncbi:MAG: cytidine deaminase [Solobacterium sp.]|nr:cytidine deaminase [Solobacterium sp.]
MLTKEELIQEAFKGLRFAYAPYSGYPVGAAVLAKDGRVFLGCNIENASYPAGNCGERTALYHAYAHGLRKDDIAALAIVTNGNTVAGPCGICRQVMLELMNADTPIYLANRSDQIETCIKELMPLSFTAEDLK